MVACFCNVEMSKSKKRTPRKILLSGTKCNICYEFTKFYDYYIR